MNVVTRGVVAGVAAITTAFGLGLASTPASAAITVQEGCTEFNAIVPVGVTVVMPLPDGCEFVDIDDGGAFSGGTGYTMTYDADSSSIIVTLTSGADGYVYANLRDGGSTYDGPAFTACGAYASGYPFFWPRIEYCDAASPAIPAWVQAYGRDKDATCEDGWDPSWQEWAQEVTGGWVCTRSIPSLG